MKINQSILQTAMLASLIFSPFAMAAECEAPLSESEISALPPLGDRVINEASFISGGICVDGINQMKSMAKNFSLEVVLVEKTEYKEGYLADIKVKITDAKDKLIVDIFTEGPFLLANLPNGRYLITAEHNNVIKENRVNIDNKKHVRVVFLWPAEPESE